MLFSCGGGADGGKEAGSIGDMHIARKDIDKP